MMDPLSDAARAPPPAPQVAALKAGEMQRILLREQAPSPAPPTVVTQIMEAQLRTDPKERLTFKEVAVELRKAREQAAARSLLPVRGTARETLFSRR